jgi:hypothetical protein
MSDPAYRLLGVTYYIGRTSLKAHVLVLATQAVAQVSYTWMDAASSPVPPSGWVDYVFAEVAHAASVAEADPFAKFYR